MCVGRGKGEGPAYAEGPPGAPACGVSFFSSILRIEVWLEELLMFIRPEMSDALSFSEGGTVKPVGFAIPSA